MELIHAILLTLVAALSAAVVLTRNPIHQTCVLGFYGLLLALLFFSLHAPDVAYSQIVVGSAAVPFMILITLMRLKSPP